MPKDLFEKTGRIFRRVQERVQNADELFLFLDYDGTLVPIRKTPRDAVPTLNLRRLLANVKNLPATTLVIVSGRSTADVKNLLRTPTLVFAANHGFEITTAARSWIHPDVRPIARQLSAMAKGLQTELKIIPGVLVENKGSTLSIHYRNVAPTRVHDVRHIVETAVSRVPKNIVITHGKKVIEIRPNVSWGKGHAVRRILHRNHPTARGFVLYCGDDETDEDVFRMAPKHAVTIRVGKSRKTRARFTVDKVSDVHRLLSLICDWRTEAMAGSIRNR